ncbi:hypothetical protein RF55_16565 [Lasius niger]|uniref:CCHC-type domain-containing protein n=1 Tax=Lasius niger TaxID=67767 RepID=A0A0J7MXF8_LASNI|nr:hypothetical protein RF55_16565 [Lasius niger]
MSRVDPEDEWVFVLNDDQLLDELTQRNLSTEGSYPILAARLLRQVRHERLGLPGASSSKSTAISDEEHLMVSPPEEVVRPDSPSPPARNRFTPGSPGTTNATRRSSGGASSNSAATAYNVMRKWNLKFTGTRGEDAETFLLRVEEGRALVPVSDEDILRCLPFFLSGMALNWFRGRKSRLTSWETFKTAWRARFGDPDFQFALRDEIMRRTQGEHEPVADYLTCINALCDRLSPPWSEAEKVNYAFRNMLPRLKIAVRREEAEDMDVLEDLATRAESSYATTHPYRAPPTPEKSLFPDLAYRPPRSANRSKHNESIASLDTSSTSATSSNTSPRKKKGTPKGKAVETAGTSNASTPPETKPKASRTSNAKCWNCEGSGHFSRDCEAAPRRHCYRCGRADVTLRTCPDCSGKD